jgi:hypothetical protein
MLVEKSMASGHALAQYELENDVASHHALARYELEKDVASHHALARCDLEKAMACEACGRSESGKNVASQACGHEPVKIPPHPQQLAPDVYQSELAKKHSIQCIICARG